jgi:hypothetical protein
VAYATLPLTISSSVYKYRYNMKILPVVASAFLFLLGFTPSHARTVRGLGSSSGSKSGKGSGKGSKSKGSKSKNGSSLCTCQSCTEKVLKRRAGLYTCGERIDYLLTQYSGAFPTETSACKRVGGIEFPEGELGARCLVSSSKLSSLFSSTRMWRMRPRSV